MARTRLVWTLAAVTGATIAGPSLGHAEAFDFSAGDLVMSVEGDGSGTGSYTDNQAAPLTLYEFAHKGTNSASLAGSLMLPQTASGANLPVSGEYGSSSEGGLQLTGNGKDLVIMGYGINANPSAYGPAPTNTALGQSGSLTGQSYTPVARVVAVIGQNGSVNSSRPAELPSPTWRGGRYRRRGRRPRRGQAACPASWDEGPSGTSQPCRR